MQATNNIRLADPGHRIPLSLLYPTHRLVRRLLRQPGPPPSRARGTHAGDRSRSLSAHGPDAWRRLSGFDPTLPQWTVDVAAKILADKGVDFLDITGGGLDHRQKIAAGLGYQVPYATAVRKAVAGTQAAVSGGGKPHVQEAGSGRLGPRGCWGCWGRPCGPQVSSRPEPSLALG